MRWCGSLVGKEEKLWVGTEGDRIFFWSRLCGVETQPWLSDQYGKIVKNEGPWLKNKGHIDVHRWKRVVPFQLYIGCWFLCCGRWDLYSSCASTSAGIELMHNEVPFTSSHNISLSPLLSFSITLINHIYSWGEELIWMWPVLQKSETHLIWLH